MDLSRRDMLGLVAKTSLATLALGPQSFASTQVAQGAAPTLLPEGAKTLKELLDALARTPRRRDFKEVPMVLTNPDQWDDAALRLLMHYRGKVKQVWDHTALDGPWLNLMRNTLNTQIWAFKHPDFLVLSATHGPAHLALYDQTMWDKYQLSKLTDGKFKENTLIKTGEAAQADPANIQDEAGVYSPLDNSIPVLQARGVVFLGCHNAIFELAHRLHQKEVNPDKLEVPQLVAELTNHLIPGVVLTPGIVGTIPELGFHGYQYAR